MGREQIQRQPERREEEPVEIQDTGPHHRKGKELEEDLDKLLDEIDSVLEENAEEFVRNYVQKGGQ